MKTEIKSTHAIIGLNIVFNRLIGISTKPAHSQTNKIMITTTHLRDSNSLDFKMGDQQEKKNKTCLTDNPAAKVVSVELNKRLKAKENEQDSIPSDDEDGYPDLGLDPVEIAKRKQLAKQKLNEDKKKESG